MYIHHVYSKVKWRTDRASYGVSYASAERGRQAVRPIIAGERRMEVKEKEDEFAESNIRRRGIGILDARTR